MSDLIGGLLQQLAGPALSRLSQTIGADEAATSKAVAVAVPLLVGALARNTVQPEGAQALHQAVVKDHDGSILDDVVGFLGGGQAGSGAGILRHVLGEQRPAVEQNLAQAAGLAPTAAGQMLELLAPVVMGWIGLTQRQQGLDASGVANLLSGQAKATPGNVLGALNTLLDADKDGSALDDVARFAMGFFKRK
ncbi:MAG: DUF937 domain-containing protein [Chloracidobacterium sp.]|uniref:DUF937 domain-containing protein n=1 Tax=Chloracidobacterium validum TaxID=2821543 RepID=A0ABX8BAS0_9BACT|nr:DUF937 domain-containing protein [Chloracidobacterium validum]QUW02728.1 DUF937 domain-containing protein [Chloracidobacterium validum]